VAKESESSPQDESSAYDLGDTSIGSEGQPDAPVRERDPKTGRFLPLEPTPEPTEATSTLQAGAEPAAASAQSAAPVPQSKHPSYLLQQAREFNLDDEEIEGMSTNVLGKVVHRLMREQLAFRAELDKERTLVHGQVRTPPPEAKPEEEDFDIDFGVDPETGRKMTAADFNPNLVHAFKSLTRQQRAENKRLQEELSKRDQRDQQRDEVRAAAIYDSAFAALGPDYEPIFGKAAGRDMDPNSPEFRRRILVLTEAQADPRQHTVAQARARIKKAAELIAPVKANPNPYAEVPKKGEPAKPTNGVKPRISEEEWNEGGLARPTARKVDDEPPGEAKAVRNLAAKMDKEVIPDSEELDGFL